MQPEKTSVHSMQVPHRTSLIDGSAGWEGRRQENIKFVGKKAQEDSKFSMEFLAFSDIKPYIVLSALVLLIAVVIVQSFNWTASLLQQPVLAVDVQGEFKFLEKNTVATVVNNSLESGYLQSDLPSLHAQLLAQPWVKEASLKRKLNSALQIELKEHTPLAIWNHKTLISTDALLFSPKVIPKELNVPMLFGRDHVDVLSVYEQLTEKMPVALLPIRSLDVNANGCITLESHTGLVLVLERSQWQRQLARFTVINDQALSRRLADVKKVDMRYSNGAAVSWKEQRVALMSQ